MKFLTLSLVLILAIASPALAMFASQRQLIPVPISMGTDFCTEGVDISQADLGSAQVVWSGGATPSGTFTMEVSNDDVAPGSADPGSNVVNWSTYPGSAISIAADGDLTYSFPDMSYRYARICYVSTSGTATATTAIFIQKHLGKI